MLSLSSTTNHPSSISPTPSQNKNLTTSMIYSESKNISLVPTLTVPKPKIVLYREKWTKNPEQPSLTQYIKSKNISQAQVLTSHVLKLQTANSIETPLSIVSTTSMKQNISLHKALELASITSIKQKVTSIPLSSAKK